jgi:hypothetical protein
MLGRRRQGQILACGSTVLLAALMPIGPAQAAPAGSAKTASCDPAVPFSSEEFGDPTGIDNEYLPMLPGTRLTYEGDVQAGGGTTPHQVVFTVTDMTQVIDGVRTRVVYDVDSDGGEVLEAELAFFAQSDAGNVWNLGEYPEEYENGVFSGAPSVWLAGLDGASGGIHMLADPEARANRHVEYLQGSAPAIDFLDCAQVAAIDGRVTVPAGEFSDVLTTHERSPLDGTSAVQVKDHAPGVGIVRISAINDPEAETLELVEAAHLTPWEMAAVDVAVLELDWHGHQVSDVYSQAPHVRLNPSGLRRDH